MFSLLVKFQWVDVVHWASEPQSVDAEMHLLMHFGCLHYQLHWWKSSVLFKGSGEEPGDSQG